MSGTVRVFLPGDVADEDIFYVLDGIDGGRTDLNREFALAEYAYEVARRLGDRAAIRKSLFDMQRISTDLAVLSEQDDDE